MFDRVAVLNLDRRPDRWDAFCERLPRPWPFPVPQRVAAVDGFCTTVPTAWQAGPGAWGCLQSHVALWAAAAEEDQTLLVFEDDAVFCEAFADRAAEFLEAVPDDWQMLYFGGQHIFPSNDISSSVVRCVGVKKTHAYAIRGAALTLIANVVRDKPTHIDVSLSLLHHHFLVYAPREWLCGQAAGRSDILSGSLGEGERWFDGRVLV